MKILHTLTLAAVTSTLLLATPQKDAQMQEDIKIGKESAMMLAKELGKNMKAHMKAGGPLDALNFCSNEAYDLTDAVNKKLKKGVSVKRISSQYRSEANKPSANEEKILNSLQSLQKSGVVLPPYLVEKVDDQTLKFYKPLVIDKPVCLKCHGVVKDPKLKNEIAQRYPNDKAMGYKINDLRGAIVVTIDKSQK